MNHSLRIAAVLAALAATLACAPTEIVVLEPLAVVNVAPAHGATNIDPSVDVIATFSRPLDESTVTSSSFFVSDAAGTAVPGTLSFDETSQTVTIDLTAALAGASTYTITITTEVADAEGETLPAAITTEFSTL